MFTGFIPKLSSGEPRPSDTIITHGVTVTGDLHSDGNIIIDGVLKGSVTTDGGISIGPNGRVTAHVDCGSLTVDGQLEGNVNAADTVFINQTGRVVGDVSCRQLDVALGAIVHGQVTTEDLEASPQTPAEDQLDT